MKHKADCKMAFGRKDTSCPRCRELLNGAKPRTSWHQDHFTRKEQRSRAVKAHFAPGGPHERGDCGLVCTAFDW